MFRASCAHHQEYKTLTRQSPVQVVTVAGWSSLCHIRDETVSFVPNLAKWGSTCNRNYLYRWLPCQCFILLMMGAWRPKHVEKVCSNKSASCSITSVFYLTLYYDPRKHKIQIQILTPINVTVTELVVMKLKFPWQHFVKNLYKIFILFIPSNIL